MREEKTTARPCPGCTVPDSPTRAYFAGYVQGLHIAAGVENEDEYVARCEAFASTLCPTCNALMKTVLVVFAHEAERAFAAVEEMRRAAASGQRSS